MRQIILSDSTEINIYGFSECPNLTSIIIAANGVHIFNGAFSKCPNLKSITIESNVTNVNIDKMAFHECSELTINIMSDDNMNALSTFKNLDCVLNIVLMEGVTTIPNNQFQSWNNLHGVSSPYTLLSVGDYAFSGCSSLLSLPIAINAKRDYNIGRSCFENCSSLAYIPFPSKIITQNTFQGCIGLTNIRFDHVDTIESYAFEGCTNLNTITFNELTNITTNAFENCPLTTVNIRSHLYDVYNKIFDAKILHTF